MYGIEHDTRLTRHWNTQCCVWNTKHTRSKQTQDKDRVQLLFHLRILRELHRRQSRTPDPAVPLLRWTTSELWCLSGGKREDYQNCSVLYCVLKLCTVISTLRWAVLTVLWIGFCHTGPISLCVDSFVCICVYFVCCFILHSCCIIVTRWGGPGGIEA